MYKRQELHRKLCRLSRTVYERRKKVLCISDASFSMVAAGRGLEHLLTLIEELPGTLSAADREFLTAIDGWLETLRRFLHQELTELPPFDGTVFLEKEEERTANHFLHQMIYIRDRLLHMLSLIHI